MGRIMHWHIGTEYYIFEFCVKEQYQSKGIGTEFLRMVEQYAKSRQITHIFLQTERTVPAFNFYKKNGFIELKDHVSLFKEFN